jgi:acyl carrier protein
MLNNFRKQIASQKLKLSLFLIPKFYFASPAEKLPTFDGRPIETRAVTEKNAIQPWVEIENRLAKLRGELVLADHGRIDNYVLGVVKGYFRTTYKDGLTIESNLSDHGLDSLDSIEIGMILEDELGYIIEAETLPQFTKVKHFSNYIKQMEAYKKEFVLLPQEQAQKSEESWNDWIPYGDKLRNTLFGMTATKSGNKNKHASH